MQITNIDDTRRAIELFQEEMDYLHNRIDNLEHWSWERRIWLFLRSIPSRVRRLFGR